MRLREAKNGARSLIHAPTVSLMVLALCGCAIKNVGPALKDGNAQVQEFPKADADLTLQDYRIGPFDTLSISVFQEADLSVKEVQVDAAGTINLALIGQVKAAGKTSLELGQHLQQLYGARFLVNPQITVSVANSISQKVIVQGEVDSPGVYSIRGPATLLEAISLAKGETRIAALNQVVILRTINGQKMGALFDVASIRRNEAADPAIYGNDVVVVGYSNARGLWQDVLQASPLFNVFRPLR